MMVQYGIKRNRSQGQEEDETSEPKKIIPVLKTEIVSNLSTFYKNTLFWDLIFI